MPKSQNLSPAEIPKLEYDCKITIKLIVTTNALPALPNIEKTGKLTEEILRLTPKLSFVCRIKIGNVTFVSPEKKAAKTGAIAA